MSLLSVFTSGSIRRNWGPLLPNKNLRLDFVQVNVNHDAKFLSWVFGDTLKKKQHLRKNWGKVTESRTRGRRDIKDIWRGDRYDFWRRSSVGGERYQAGVKRHDRRGKEGRFLKCLAEISSPDLLSSSGGLLSPLRPSEHPDWAPPTAVAPLRNIYPQMYNSPQLNQSQSRSSRSPSFTAWSLTPAGKLWVNSECLQKRRITRFFCSSSFMAHDRFYSSRIYSHRRTWSSSPESFTGSDLPAGSPLRSFSADCSV